MIRTRNVRRLWNRFSRFFFGAGPWQSPTGKQIMKPRSQRQVGLETLEDRITPATFLYSTSTDTLTFQMSSGEAITSAASSNLAVSFTTTGTFTDAGVPAGIIISNSGTTATFTLSDSTDPITAISILGSSGTETFSFNTTNTVTTYNASGASMTVGSTVENFRGQKAVTAIAGLTVNSPSIILYNDITTAGNLAFATGPLLNAASTAVALSYNSATFTNGVSGLGTNSLTLSSSGTTNVNGNFVNLVNLSVTGGTTSLSGSITTTGTQTYSGAVTLAANTVLEADTGLANQLITFGSTVAGATFNLTIADDAKFQGAVTNVGTLAVTGTTNLNSSIATTGNQTYTGVVTLAGDSTLSSTGVSATLTTTAGFTGAGKNLTLNFPTVDVGSTITGVANLDVTGATAINLGTVTTTGTQTYNNTVTLAAATTLTGTTITLAGVSAATSAKNLTIIGNPTFGTAITSGNVGALAVTGNATINAALAVASVTVSGTTTAGANVTTTGGTQAYTGLVTLSGSADTRTFTATTVTFTGGVTGAANSLTVTGAGVFGGTTSGVAVLSVSGTTSLNGSIATTGNQTYTGAVTLAGNGTLSSTGVSATLTTTAGITGAGKNLTLNFPTVTVLGSGGSAITNVRNLDVTGTTTLGSVTTTGTQTYNSPVTLSGATTLIADSGTNELITFNSYVAGGGFDLAISDKASFLDNVTQVANLTVTDTTTAGANITTSGTQAYTGRVTLSGSATTRIFSGTTVTFTGGVTGATNSLTVYGAGVFSATTSGVNALSVSGTTTIGADISTTGTQTYTAAVTLAATTVLTADTGSANQLITFGNTVAGATFNLSIADNAKFQSAVTGVGTLGVTGTSDIGANITTAGTQTYTGNATLSANVSLATTNSNITFGGTLNSSGSNRNLTTDSGTVGNLYFQGVTGGSFPLGDLVVSSVNTINVDGNLTAKSFTATASTVAFDSAGFTISTKGTPNNIGGAIAITTSGSIITGTLETDGGVVDSAGNGKNAGAINLVSGSSINVGALSAKGSNALTSGNGGDAGAITLTPTTTLQLSGNITATGGTGVDTGGTGGSGAALTFGRAVTLGASITLDTRGGTGPIAGTSGAVDFTSTVAGSTALTVLAGAASVKFQGAVTSVSALAVTGGTINLYTNISTNDGPVTFTGATVLYGNIIVDTTTTVGNTVTFDGTLDSNSSLRDLTIDAGTAGNVNFTGITGGTLRPRYFEITSANTVNVDADFTAYDFYVASTAFDSTGAVTISTAGQADTVGGRIRITTSGALAAATLTTNGGTAGSGTGKTGGAISLISSASTVAVGAISAIGSDAVAGVGGNAGLVTLNPFTTLTLNGNITVTGGNGVSGNGGNGTALTFADAVILGANITLDTLGGTGTAPGASGAVDFQSTVNGGWSLTVEAGTFTFGGIVGGSTKIGTLAVTGSTINLNADISTSDATATFTGPVVLGAGVTVDTSVSTGGAIEFTSTVNSFDSTARVLTVDAGISTVKFNGPVGATNPISTLAVTGNTINLFANISTSDAAATFTGATVLYGNIIVDTTTTAVGNTVTFDGTLNSNALVRDLTIDAGTAGDVNFTGITGAGLRLGELTITSANTVNVDADFTANKFTVASATFDSTVAVTISTAGLADTAGGDISITTSLALAANALTSTGGTAGPTNPGQDGGAISLISTTSSVAVGAISASGSAGGTGTTTGGDAGSVSLNSHSAYTITLNGNITATGGNGSGAAGGSGTALTFADAVNLGANTILDTRRGGGTGGSPTDGAVDFQNTVNGAQTLTVLAGAAAVTFKGTVGGTTPISALAVTGSTITLPASVTSTGIQTYTGPVALTANTTLAGTTITLAGISAGTARDLSITGNPTFGTAVASGNVAVLDVTGSATINADLAVTSVAVSVTTTAGADITTTGTQAYSSLVTLSGSAATRTFVGSTVTFTGGVTGGANSLVVTGNGVFAATTLGVAVLSVSGTSSLSGSITTTGTQTYTGNATLSTAVSLATTNSNITFSGTLNGAQNLTLESGLGNILFTGGVGMSTRLAAVTINAAANVTIGGNLMANSFNQAVAGTGTFLLTGYIGTSPSGITINSNTVTLNNNVTADGAVSVTQTAGILVVDTYFDSFSSTISLNALDFDITNGFVLGRNSNLSFNTISSTNLSLGTAVSGATITDTELGYISGALRSGVNHPATFTGQNIYVGGVTGASTTSISLATLTSAANTYFQTNSTFAQGLTVTATAGSIELGANLTTGTQTYNSPVTLSVNTTLIADTTSGGGGTAQLVTFASTVVGGGFDLAISDNARFQGAVTNVKILGVTGTSNIGANITTTGTQTYSGAVTLAANTVLTADNTGANQLITFGSTVAGATFNLTIADDAKFQGAVTNVGALAVTGTTNLNSSIATNGNQTYTGVVTLAGDSTLSGTGTATLTTTAGITGAGNNLTLNFPTVTVGSTITGVRNLAVTGTTRINLGTVTTTGTQTYNSSVTLSGDTTLIADAVPGNQLITFGSTVAGGGFSLAIADNASFLGNVTAVATLEVTGTTSLSGSITTTANQTYTGAVTLAGNSTLTGTGSATLTTTAGIVGAGSDLTLNFPTVTVGSAITGVGNLDVTGATAINLGDVTTTGTQTYHNTVTLAANTTLAGTTITLAGISASAKNLSITGNPTFGTAVASGNVAVLDVTGSATINADLAVTSVAVSVTTTAGADITTTGTQAYTGLVTLSGTAATRNFTGTTVTFTGGVTGGINSLKVTGNATITADSTATSVTVTGTTSLWGSITTTSNQSYTGAVTLAGTGNLTGTSPATLTTTAGIIGAGNDLTLNFATVTVLGSGGSAITGVRDLSVTGATAINLGTVTTTGTQTYNSPVTLSGDTTLIADASGNNQLITFTSTVAGGGFDLAISDNARFQGAVTAVKTLGVTGTSNIGADITTSGTQAYTGRVTLSGSATTRTFAGTTVTFTGGVTGATNSLTVTGAGVFSATTSGVNVLSVSGITTIGANISTTGTQTYTGAVTLAANATLTADTGSANQLITFSNTVAGATFNLSIADNAKFQGAVTNVGTLGVTGTSDIGANITTAGTQTYSDNATLSAAVTLATTNSNITFSGTLNSDATARALTLASGFGHIVFTGTVGNSAPTLAAVTINAAADVTISAAFKANSFNQAVVGTGTFLLNGALTTSAGAVTINSRTDTINATIASGSSNINLTQTTGTLTLDTTFTSTGTINFTAHDFNIVSPFTITPTPAAVNYNATSGTDLYLGTAGGAGDTSFSNAELALIVGPASFSGNNVYVNGVDNTGTANLTAVTITSALDTVFQTVASSYGASGTDDLTVTATAGNITLGTNVSAGGTVVLNATTGAILVTANATVTSTMEGITLNGDVTGTANSLVLSATNTTNGAISIGLTGASKSAVSVTALTATAGTSLDLSDATVTTVRAGAVGGSVTLESVTNLTTGSITTSGGTATNSNGYAGGAVSLTTTGAGNISVGAIDASGSAGVGTDKTGGNGGAITFVLPSAQTITLNGNLNTSGGANTGTGTVGTGAAVTLGRAVVLGGNTTITTTGSTNGAVDFSETLNGRYALDVLAGTAAVTFTGIIGTAVDHANTLSSLTVTSAGAVTFSANAFIAGETLVTGSTSITLTGATYDSTTDGFAFTGPVSLTNATATNITTGLLAGDDIAFSSTLNSVNAAPKNLTLVAGVGGISFGAAVGGTNRFDGLVITSAGAITSQAITANSFTVTTATSFNSTTYGITTLLTGQAGGAVNIATTGIITTGTVNTAGGTESRGGYVGLAAGNVTLNSSAGVVTVGAVLASGSNSNQSADGGIGGTVAITGTAITLNGGINAAGGIGDVNGAAAGGAITLTGTTTLGTATNYTLTTGAGAGNISVDAIVGGAKNLKLVSGLGNITASGDLTGLGTLTLQDGALFLASAGNATFNGAVSATALVTYDTVYNLSLLGGGTITGNTTLRNTGTLALGDGTGSDVLTFTGGLNATAASSITTGGTIATTSKNLTLGDFTTTASTTFGAGTGVITLGAATLGTNTLTLGQGGTGAINITTVDDGSATGGLTLASAGVVTVAGKVDIAGALTISNSTDGSANFTRDVATGTLTANAGAYDLLFLENLTTTTAGSATTLGAVSRTVRFGDASDDVATFAGGLVTTAVTGTLQLAGSVSAASTKSITLGAATLATPLALTTAGAGGNLQTGAITSNGNSLTVDAGGTLTLGAIANLTGGLTVTNAGGAASIGALGTISPGNVTITNSTAGVTFSGNVSANTLAVTDTDDTQPITFANAQTVSINTLTLGATAYNLAVNSDAFTVTNAATLGNTGSVTLGNEAADMTTFAGGVTRASGTTKVAGTLRAVNNNITLPAFNATASATLGAGSGTITTGRATVDNSGSTLTLGQSGSGNINVAGVTGASTVLADIVFNTLGTVNMTDTIGGSVDELAITNVGLANFDAAVSAVSFNQSAGSSAFDYALTLSGAFAFKGSQLLLDGAVTGATTVGVNATTSFTTGNGGTINASGAFTQNGVGANYLDGNITADSLTFGQPVNLTGAVTMTTGLGSGDNILINNALNGAYDLTLVAGLGNVTLRNVGNIVDLNSIVVSSGAALNLLNAVEAGSFTATITGIATVRGITTAAAGSVSITATAGVSTYSRPIIAGTGGFTLNSSAGTVLISTASPITSAGIVSLTGATGISVGSNLTTADGTVNLVGATTLINDIAVTTGTGAVTFTGTVNGARNLVVNAGGQTEFTSTVGNSTPLSSLTLDGGASAKLGGSVTTVNALTLGDNVTLAANVTLATTNAPITVYGTVNGTTASTQTLGLTAGTGTIILASPLGGGTRLGAMTVNSAGNLMAAAITATSLTQSAGTGTSTLDGAVNLTGNLAFTGRNLTINAGVTAGSTVAVVNTGVFTTGAAGDITATGAFTQSGSGGTNILAGDITTTNANVTLAGATQLAGPVAISTGAGAGNILFSNSLNGGQDLTLTGGTGNVSLNGAVGNMTPLGTIQINSAAVTNLANQVNAAAFTQSAGTGATTIRGLNTTAVGGINVTATGISLFSRRLNTANGGPITLNATTGTLNLAVNIPSVTASNTISLTGATVTIATAVNAGNNAITVTTNSLALTGSLNSGTANTTILTRAVGTAIDLGGAGSGSVLGISAAEVAKVTAGRLVVGSTANTGGISVTDSIALGSLNFSAITGTTIDFAAKGVLSGSLATTDVVLTATGAITATGSTEDVVANTLTATAASIGTGDSPLRTRVNNLSTNTSGSNGAQYLSQDSGVDALITAADINAGSNTVYLLGGKFVTATGCNILSSVEVRSGATLTGTGSVSGAVNILSGGIFFPGSSTSPYVGTISTGSVTMTSGSTFSTYMGSSNTCGAVSSSGVVALGGATLNITGVAAGVTTGNVFTLLTGTSLTGQFNGLAEAAIFSAGGKNFRINYTATSVTLTVVA